MSELTPAEQEQLLHAKPQIAEHFHDHSDVVITNRNNQKKRRGFSFKKYILLPFTIIVLITGVLIGGRFVNFAKSVSLTKQSFFKDLASSIPGLGGLDDSAVAQSITNRGSINILLLGYGGSGHSGDLLTDSIVVIHFDFKTNQVALISVPRDLWVKIPTSGYNGPHMKINAAYEIGAASQNNYPDKLPQFTGPNGAGNESKYELSQVLGIPIDYFASIDFSGFKEIVSTLGGVDINVDNAFTDYTYPNGDQNTDGPSCYGETPSSSCRYLVVHFDAGEQHMDGDTALEYVRSRHAAGVEGSDFARSKRQQKLIAAIEQKALQFGAVSKIFSLMDDVQGHFQTDLSIAEIKDLASYAGNLDFDNAARISLTDGNFLVSSYSSDGQWILQPRAGIDDFSQVREYIKEQLDPNEIKTNQKAAANNSGTAASGGATAAAAQ